MTSAAPAWIAFKHIAAEFSELFTRALQMTSPDRLEALLRLLHRLELAYLDLPHGDIEPRPNGQTTWRHWFHTIKSCFPELTTYRSVHPTSLDWPEPKLRALPDELALVLSSIDYALAEEEKGDELTAMLYARTEYEQQIGEQIAHLRAYVYHQRFDPQGSL